MPQEGRLRKARVGLIIRLWGRAVSGMSYPENESLACSPCGNLLFGWVSVLTTLPARQGPVPGGQQLPSVDRRGRASSGAGRSRSPVLSSRLGGVSISGIAWGGA